MSEFDGKAVVVTGGGSGIGRAIAFAFAAQGARVLVADIDEDGSRETVTAIEQAGGTASFVRCDVADANSVGEAVDLAVSRFGRLDYAINSAGIDPEIAPEPHWEIAEFDRIVAINLRGVMLSMRAEIAAMRQSGGGAIVNLGSFAGVAGVANKPFYSAAKHGVIGMTKSVALDQAKHGIRVNAICPGFIRTPMSLANMDDVPGGVDMVSARNPTRRVGEADEIAAAALYLCSDKAGFVIGQALSVDGGISAQ